MFIESQSYFKHSFLVKVQTWPVFRHSTRVGSQNLGFSCKSLVIKSERANHFFKRANPSFTKSEKNNSEKNEFEANHSQKEQITL